MPRSTKAPHEIQIQASKTVKTTMTNLDADSKRYLDFVKRYAQEVLGMNLSESVIIRWALFQGYLTLMEQMVRAYDGVGKDTTKAIEKLMEYQEFNRQKFLDAACK